MKKALLLIIPLMIFISCEDKEKEEVSAFVGTWDVTFIGDYENADCTGDLDSTEWDFAQAFGLEMSVTMDDDGTYETSISILGEAETETGTWSENSDGTLIVDDEVDEGIMATDGKSFSVTSMEDAYCEDSYTYEVTSHTDSTSCADAGNDWWEASCNLMIFTKQ